jgi:hypothetical protein
VRRRTSSRRRRVETSWSSWSRARKEVRGSGSRPGDAGGGMGVTIDWSAEPAVSMIPILATRHAVRGMMSGAGRGVNAEIGVGNRVVDAEPQRKSDSVIVAARIEGAGGRTHCPRATTTGSLWWWVARPHLQMPKRRNDRVLQGQVLSFPVASRRTELDSRFLIRVRESTNAGRSCIGLGIALPSQSISLTLRPGFSRKRHRNHQHAARHGSIRSEWTRRR